MAAQVEEMDLSQYKNRRHELSYFKLDEFRKNDTVWDVTLKSTDGKEIRAHKCVLASQSYYFERMFIGGFLETNKNVIQINDITGDIMRNIIDFMYSGELVTIDKDNVEEILNAADMFQMEDVRNACLQYYLPLVGDTNCLAIKEIADLRAMTTLSEKCLKHALERFVYIVDHQSYLDADVTQIIELLKDDNLGPQEEDRVYRGVIKWIKHDETQRKHLLPDLLEHVRLVFTSKDFLLQEVTKESLINSNPKCLEIFNKVIDHFDYQYGEPLSKLITNAKPRKNTNRFTIDEMTRRRYYDCSETPAEYSETETINLIDYLKDFDSNHHFSQIEWNQYMNENSFFAPFNEVWRGNNDFSDDEDSDY